MVSFQGAAIFISLLHDHRLKHIISSFQSFDIYKLNKLSFVIKKFAKMRLILGLILTVWQLII